MPLSEAAPRKRLHTRAITLHGYQREDGLFDIEAELIDTKGYDFTIGTRVVATGAPLHHMLARLTVNEDMVIVHAEAVTEAGPYGICGGGAESFSRIEGLAVKPGFLRAAEDRLGGTIGCTHLRELLQQLGTVAFQTTFPVRARRETRSSSPRPRLLNSCFAFASDSDVVKERWPDHYIGPGAAAEKTPAPG